MFGQNAVVKIAERERVIIGRERGGEREKEERVREREWVEKETKCQRG